MSRPLWIFAGGGTGGHLFPALAIVEHLREQDHGIDCEFFCTERPLDREVLQQWNVPCYTQPVQALPRRVLAVPGFLRAWRRSINLCVERLAQRRPAVVVGTGGFASAPAVKTAARSGIPTAILNPDVKPGKANRHLAARVNEIYVQWAESLAHFKRSGQVRVTGCPVRRQFFEAPTADDHAGFGLDPAGATLLVTGASSGARTLNEALIRLARELSQLQGWQILHISGHADQARVRQAYADAGVRAVVPSFTHRAAAALRCADLAVCRSGAVTLAELSVTGTPAILLPYPHHRDRHQYANAEILVARGAAVVVEDSADSAGCASALRAILLPLLGDVARINRMAEAARGATPPAATEQITAHLLRLAGS